MVLASSLAFPGLVLTAPTWGNMTYLLSEVAASETTYARWAQGSITEKWCKASRPRCGEKQCSWTCELRKRLTDSFGLIPDAKPPKWRLAGLHWEKIRVRRMGFLNQA